MPQTPKIPRRPYLLRAMHSWMSDSGHTPHLIVAAERPLVDVPRSYVKDGKIVLNVSHGATQGLKLGNEWVEFHARFAGTIYHVKFPMNAVLGIYARETGEGLAFAPDDLGPEPPSEPQPPDESRRPQLKVVK